MSSVAVEVIANAWFTWRGLRFDSKPPKRANNEVERYECTTYPFNGWIYRNTAGQWIAGFEVGPYSIENTRDEALEVARQKAVAFLDYKRHAFAKLGW